MKCFYVSFAVVLSQVFLLTFFCGTRTFLSFLREQKDIATQKGQVPSAVL